MIPVSKPFLPPKKEYEELISKIWETHWLTNAGPLIIELEKKLVDYLDVSNILFVANGTLALQMAIKSLDLEGEIITTPFSFVATTSSIVWENCKPVFVDIDETSLNIDASKIEDSITPKTTAILATHVYGNPCDVLEIEKIAKKHHLKVIYDGAHAFGVKVHGKSIFEFGDITICSTHATKIYHTIEGGFIVTKNKTLLDKLKLIRNFGFKDSVSFACLGTNAKNSEFHAAMGLINLDYIDDIIEKRKCLTNLYDELLKNKGVKKPTWHKKASISYSYFPLIFSSEELLLNCVAKLEEHEIFARRYFYPSLSESLPYVDASELKVVDKLSKRVLCLPLYYDLTEENIKFICNIICQEYLLLNKGITIN